MSALLALEILVLIAFFAVVASALLIYGTLFASIFRDAPFVPSPRKVAEAMMDLAKVQPGELVVDLGSGHGEILFAAARRGAQALGYELSYPLVWFTALRRWFSMPRADVRALRQDFFGADLTQADVVTCYIFPKAMAQLAPKFERQLKVGARVACATFRIPGWTPAQVMHIANRPIFLYHCGK